jgi:hypothetical protein
VSTAHTCMCLRIFLSRALPRHPSDSLPKGPEELVAARPLQQAQRSEGKRQRNRPQPQRVARRERERRGEDDETEGACVLEAPAHVVPRLAFPLPLCCENPSGRALTHHTHTGMQDSTHSDVPVRLCVLASARCCCHLPPLLCSPPLPLLRTSPGDTKAHTTAQRCKGHDDTQRMDQQWKV